MSQKEGEFVWAELTWAEQPADSCSCGWLSLFHPTVFLLLTPCLQNPVMEGGCARLKGSAGSTSVWREGERVGWTGGLRPEPRTQRTQPIAWAHQPIAWAQQSVAWARQPIACRQRGRGSEWDLFIIYLTRWVDWEYILICSKKKNIGLVTYIQNIWKHKKHHNEVKSKINYKINHRTVKNKHILP